MLSYRLTPRAKHLTISILDLLLRGCYCGKYLRILLLKGLHLILQSNLFCKLSMLWRCFTYLKHSVDSTFSHLQGIVTDTKMQPSCTCSLKIWGVYDFQDDRNFLYRFHSGNISRLPKPTLCWLYRVCSWIRPKMLHLRLTCRVVYISIIWHPIFDIGQLGCAHTVSILIRQYRKYYYRQCADFWTLCWRWELFYYQKNPLHNTRISSNG
jgi:hypothetical protein